LLLFACPVVGNRVIHGREFWTLVLISVIGREMKMSINVTILVVYIVATVVSFAVAGMMMKRG